MYTIQYKKWETAEQEWCGRKFLAVSHRRPTLEGFTDFTQARKRALEIIKEKMSICNNMAYKARETQKYVDGVLHHCIRVWCGRHPYQVTIKAHAPTTDARNDLTDFLNAKPTTEQK
jgi:hypothetical protein